LGIEKEPVGVKYTDEDPGVEFEEGSYTVCGGLLEAADGKIIMLSEETCACPGGRSHLGLSQAREVSLEMLVEGEKLWCDLKTDSSVEHRERENSQTTFWTRKEGLFISGKKRALSP